MKASAKKHNAPKKIILRIIAFLLPFALMYWIFFVKIPSEVSYADIWSTITALTWWQNLLLLLAGLLTIVVYGWTSSTVLPGLPLREGTQSAVSGQLTSVILPAPLDLVIRFNMYKSYGFSVDQSTVAVGVAGIARYFTVFTMPVIGLAALILTGQATESNFLWFIGGSLAILTALWVIRYVLASKKSAQKVGKIFQKILNGIYWLIRRKPRQDIEKVVVDFGARTHDIALTQFKPISISNIAWGFSCYIALFLAARFCGITSADMSAAYLLFLTGLMLLLNAFPITPGGIGVTETILVTIVPFPNEAVQAAFISALFVYRIYTWLLPMPVGLVAYGSWRHKYKTKVSIA